MPTPPTGTRTPTRPEPAIEQPQLFDAAALVATIEDRLGRWGGTYSVAMTLTLDATLNRLLPTQHGRRKVARATLIATGGRGWTDIPSELVAFVADCSAGRARNHQRALVAGGILERDPDRPRTWRPGAVTRLAMPQIVSRAPGAREISTVSRAPGARATQRPEREDHHHQAGDDPKSQPQRLPWETDTPCPRCATGRLALKPDGDLDEVCKTCRRAQRAAADTAPPPAPRRTHCECGGLLPLGANGQPRYPCDECFERGDAGAGE